MYIIIIKKNCQQRVCVWVGTRVYYNIIIVCGSFWNSRTVVLGQKKKKRAR